MCILLIYCMYILYMHVHILYTYKHVLYMLSISVYAMHTHTEKGLREIMPKYSQWLHPGGENLSDVFVFSIHFASPSCFYFFSFTIYFPLWFIPLLHSSTSTHSSPNNHHTVGHVHESFFLSAPSLHPLTYTFCCLWVCLNVAC